MSLKVRIYRPCYGGGSNISAFTAFIKGVEANGDSCKWTKTMDETCDVAVHPSGPKSGPLRNHRLSRDRQALIDRYPDRRIVIESPVFREGVKLQSKTYWRVGWNGFLRGDSDYMNEGSPHDRWEMISAEQKIELHPSSVRDTGNILVMLQTATDASVRDVDMNRWPGETKTEAGKHLDAPVVLRPHPKGLKHPPPPLKKALDEARVVITYTSLSAIEAICAGVPTFADEKSLSWPMVSPSLKYLNDPLLPPDGRRLQWLADLAYAQWTEEEIASGSVWERLRKRIA